MAAVEPAMRSDREGRSVVVVPYGPLDKWDEPPAETQAYEERLLCSLLELRDPALRMTYVTSSPVASSTVAYYLSFLPRRMRRQARRRLTLIDLGDRTARPLSEKLLERPCVLERIRRSVPVLRRAHVAPYNTTGLERDLALALRIPIYGADPRHAHLGTKSGCRELFSLAGVPHPLGMENITSTADAIRAVADLRSARPGLAELVMKLNEGVSGEGNAIVNLDGLPRPGAPDELQLIAERVATLTPDAGRVTPAVYLAQLAKHGGVVEERITGDEVRSPSVQLQIIPAGHAKVLSTHDQILGGPNGQYYLGCRFPADPAYAPEIAGLAGRVAEKLVKIGVIGHFAIDFVVARRADHGWQPFAIELNLRKGGTTHPYQTLARLSGGGYDPERARFITPGGRQKHYVATDHFVSPQLRSLGRDGVLALAQGRDLRFDRLRGTGPVFHMLSSVDELGRTGFTAIGDSVDEADAIFETVRSKLTMQRGPRELARARPVRHASTVAVAAAVAAQSQRVPA
jgi:hypothetical protein